MCNLKIYTKDDAVSVKKENGTEVDYFIFNEYEIHLNKIPPHSIQEYHKHRTIDEAVIVTKGQIVLKWMEEGLEKSRVITKGMVIRMGNNIHTLENITDNFAEFNVIRTVPTGRNNKEIIKNDKVLWREEN
ncbi:hypothetical protein NL50_07965 [Clostridium acetobutylicum]|nr:hypothetical protein NL50_07965 [Clostridium acetobutylicum]